jgi:hypothetical protein
MEHCGLAETYAEVKTLFNEFVKMWQGWGIDVQPISEGDSKGLWLIKHGENILRPLYISVIPDPRGEDKLPWVSLGSNEKVSVLKAEAQNRRYLRSYFERLTEYLVLEATQPIALGGSKLYIQKSGKRFNFYLSAEDDPTFVFSFYLRRKGWTWMIRRWLSCRGGWVVIDKVYRPFDDNPIEAFVNIISNIGLLLI